MALELDDYDRALDRAAGHAREWLGSLDARPLVARRPADDYLAGPLGGSLPEDGIDPAALIDLLAAEAEPGLMGVGSGRFYGWVMGGALPAALAADWLVSAWDQNAGMRPATPAVVALEEIAAGWLLDLLGFPATAGVGFVTGGTMANFTGLAAGRDSVLRRAGWDVVRDGLTGGPKVRVLVGAERHDTVDLALRYLGLGAPTVVAADEQGRIAVDALAEALDGDAPTIVCLQAGNLHSGAFDPFGEAIALTHERGAWVHVDGAFGLWAAAVPELAPLTTGLTTADSWATDAHKTLNVPYDCGIAVVADAAALTASLGVHADYLATETAGPGNPYERAPELSRRARGVPVWAALRSLGRAGVVDLVARLVRTAGEFARQVQTIDGATVLNDVVYTQVCVAFETDERTRAAAARLHEDGTTIMSASRWRGRDVIRISVSNHSTDADDIRRSVDALRRAAGA